MGIAVAGYVWVTVSPPMKHKEETITICYSRSRMEREAQYVSFLLSD